MALGPRGEFREEDQLCCAWIAKILLEIGYQPEDLSTAEIIERWGSAPVEEIISGASAKYLKDSGQWRDLEFILGHIDGLEEVYRYECGEVVKVES